jgi:hypothetical protein
MTVLVLVSCGLLLLRHAQGNRAPVFVALNPSRASENLEPGSYVTSLNVFDFDQGDSHTFELATRGDYLYVEGNKLYANNRALNYERDETLYINIVVTDDGSPPQTKSFQVGLGLNDANDAPATILVSNQVIDTAIHTAGDQVANLTVRQIFCTFFTSNPESHPCFPRSLTQTA